ncbi:hypothetical protein F441_14472, partial [Phytophthora nicotianae CJ01A1]
MRTRYSLQNCRGFSFAVDCPLPVKRPLLLVHTNRTRPVRCHSHICAPVLASTRVPVASVPFQDEVLHCHPHCSSHRHSGSHCSDPHCHYGDPCDERTDHGPSYYTRDAGAHNRPSCTRDAGSNNSSHDNQRAGAHNRRDGWKWQ